MITTLAEFSAELAALPPWGGRLQFAPVEFPIGPQFIWLQQLTGVTLDLNGARFVSQATVVEPRLFFPAMIMLQNCCDCAVLNGSADSAGTQNSFIGLEWCTDCEISGNLSQNTSGGWAQFGSLGGVRNVWRGNTARNSQGTERGFWLGGANAGEVETDIVIDGNKALNNRATGIAVGAKGARIINNLCLNNQGAGICSGTSANCASSDHIVTGNVCRGNAFWGWQSDVWNAVDLQRVIVTGNAFQGNAGGAALVNACVDFTYADNLDFGVVQVIGSKAGQVALSPSAILTTNGPANTNVAFR